MTVLNKQARHVQRYTNYGVDMMAWDDGTYVKYSDYLARLDELAAAKKRIADQHGIILSARNFISEYAQNGDVGAAEFVKILDRAAGIGVKGE